MHRFQFHLILFLSPFSGLYDRKNNASRGHKHSTCRKWSSRCHQSRFSRQRFRCVWQSTTNILVHCSNVKRHSKQNYYRSASWMGRTIYGTFLCIQLIWCSLVCAYCKIDATSVRARNLVWIEVQRSFESLREPITTESRVSVGLLSYGKPQLGYSYLPYFPLVTVNVTKYILHYAPCEFRTRKSLDQINLALVFAFGWKLVFTRNRSVLEIQGCYLLCWTWLFFHKWTFRFSLFNRFFWSITGLRKVLKTRWIFYSTFETAFLYWVTSSVTP